MSISCRSLLRNIGTVFALLLSVASIASWAAAAGATESFDLVLKGGRVIDPETGLEPLQGQARHRCHRPRRIAGLHRAAPARF